MHESNLSSILDALEFEQQEGIFPCHTCESCWENYARGERCAQCLMALLDAYRDHDEESEDVNEEPEDVDGY